jgi:NADH:ubiquinone oxidoreductase subunit 5 (subunit L)/multisubunit Na+/H+ antiporter MnhA subunit
VFLGEPRSEEARHAHEAGWGMLFSMSLLAILCVGLAIASPKIVLSMQQVIGQISGLQEPLIGEQLASLSTILGRIIFVLVLFAGLIGLVWLWRMWMLCGQRRTSGPTWDCGYAAPTARMQYTASSFAQPIVRLFRVFLRSRSKYFPAEGLFPQRGIFHTDTPDAGHRYMYLPLYKWMTQTALRLHWLQSGRLQVYVLYIALTLWILLIWKLK